MYDEYVRVMFLSPFTRGTPIVYNNNNNNNNNIYSMYDDACTCRPCHAGARATSRPRGPARRTIFYAFIYYYFYNIFIILKQLKSKINQIKFRKIP